MNYVYAGLEIGNTSLRFIVSEIIHDKVNILYKKIIPGTYLKNNLVTDPITVGKMIDEYVDDANFLLKMNISKVLLVLPSFGLTINKISRTINLQEPKTITFTDIDALKMDIMIAKSGHETLAPIEIISTSYSVDDKETTFKPIGQRAFKSLKLEGYLYSINKKIYENYLQIFVKTKAKILDVIIDAFAWQEEVFKSVADKENAVIVDYGHTKTLVMVYSHQFLTSIDVLPFGVNNIDKDVNYVVDCDNFAKLEELRKTCIKLVDQPVEEPFIIKQKCFPLAPNKIVDFTSNELNVVAKARIVESFEKIYKTALERTEGNLSTVYLVGGGASLHGLEEFLHNYMNLDEIVIYNSNTINAKNPSLWNVLGSIKYKHHSNTEESKKDTSLKNNFSYTLKKSILFPRVFSEISKSINKKLFNKGAQ